MYRICSYNLDKHCFAPVVDAVMLLLCPDVLVCLLMHPPTSFLTSTCFSGDNGSNNGIFCRTHYGHTGPVFLAIMRLSTVWLDFSYKNPHKKNSSFPHDEDGSSLSPWFLTLPSGHKRRPDPKISPAAALRWRLCCGFPPSHYSGAASEEQSALGNALAQFSCWLPWSHIDHWFYHICGFFFKKQGVLFWFTVGLWEHVPAGYFSDSSCCTMCMSSSKQLLFNPGGESPFRGKGGGQRSQKTFTVIYIWSLLLYYNETGSKWQSSAYQKLLSTPKGFNGSQRRRNC